MRCASCSKGVLIEIRMCVADRDLVFRCCGTCDARTWEDDGDHVSLHEVLDLARSA